MGLRLVSLAVATGASLAFLGTAAGGSQPSFGTGAHQGHVLAVASAGPLTGGRSIVSPEGVLRVPPGTRVVPGRVLVRFRRGVAMSARSDAVGRLDASVGTAYQLVPRLELLHLPAGESVVSAIAALSRDPRVEYALPDLEVKVAATPNDPLYASEWSLPAIGAPAAWDRTTGSAAVKVAVLDTGVDPTHPDLAPNLVPGWNFVDNTSDASDAYGHGTFVAGIIGAAGNNGVGVAGINWHVSIMPLKVCDQYCTLDGEISALQYALNHGAKIANASFGGYYGGYQPEEDAITAAGQAGLLYVAAAGNANLDNDVTPFYPASYPLNNIISVTATTSDGRQVYNYGPNSIQIAAPGDNLVSTLPTSGLDRFDPSGYGGWGGTSFAAPQVSGAAALLWAEHPAWTMQQVRMRLLTTASPLASLYGKVTDCGQLNVDAATDPALADHASVCVTMRGTGGGSVSSQPAGIQCGASCVASVPVGTSLTLSGTPSAGSTFVGWSGACSGSGACIVNATGIAGVTATFQTSGSPPGWQQKRLHSPAARDPFLPQSSPDSTFYNAAVSADGSERAETIYNPPGFPSFCYFDSTDTGGVFLEHRTAAGWVADGQVTAPSVPGFAGDGAARWANCYGFGTITQLSADGTTLLVAAKPGSVVGDPVSGIRSRCAAYVYQRGGSGWTLDTGLYPPGVDARGSIANACDFFGSGGTISADGSRVAMIDGGVDGSGQPVVSADVYVRASGVWSLEQQITPPSANTDCGGVWGTALSLSGDGSTLLVGDSGCDDGALSGAGLVYAYTRSGSQWTLAQTIHSPQPTQLENFGEQTALSEDGNTAVIGGVNRSGNAVWVFERGAGGWQMSAVLSNPDVGFACPTIVQDGARVLCRDSYATVGFDDGQGFLDIFDRPAGGWGSAQSQAQQAFASDGVSSDFLGSMALEAPEDGSFVDASIALAGLISGAYPHDRIGDEFTTGPIDKTLTVNVGGGGSGSISSDLPGISCGLMCWHDYADSTSVTLTASPVTGSAFSGWTGGCSGTGPCHLTMNADRTANATFTVIPEPLTLTKAGNGSGTVTSSPAGISCGATCAHSFNYGTSVQLDATAAAGSIFGGWTGGGCSGASSCTVSMTQARSVTATFSVPEKLTVSRAGTGKGSVTSTPAGISCGSTCAHSYVYGTSVQLNAKAAIGSAFTGWTGGGCSGTGTCTVSMTQARTVTATFATRPPVTLKVTRAGAGTVTSSPAGISCGSTCSHAYSYGTSVTLTAHATSTSVFIGWSGACTGTSKTCHVAMTAALATTARFVATKLLTVTKAGTGSGQVVSSPIGISCGVTCKHAFAARTVVTLTATAKPGSKFAGWSGACSGTGKCVVKMGAAKTVKATFVRTAPSRRSPRRGSLATSSFLLFSQALRRLS